MRPGEASSEDCLEKSIGPSWLKSAVRNASPLIIESSFCPRLNKMIAPRLFLLQAVLGLLLAPTAFAERRVRSRSPRNPGHMVAQAIIFDRCYVRGTVQRRTTPSHVRSKILDLCFLRRRRVSRTAASARGAHAK